MEQIDEKLAGVQFGFLVTDLDIATTFLDTSEISQIPETRLRNIANATRAHDTVASLASKANLPSHEASVIEERLHLLQERINKVSNETPAVNSSARSAADQT